MKRGPKRVVEDVQVAEARAGAEAVRVEVAVAEGVAAVKAGAAAGIVRFSSFNSKTALVQTSISNDSCTTNHASAFCVLDEFCFIATSVTWMRPPLYSHFSIVAARIPLKTSESISRPDSACANSAGEAY